MITAAPSKNAVRKAGSTIRRYARDEASLEELDAAIDVMIAYRAQFTAPLVKVNNALRSFCASLDIDGDVTQRLKKAPTIVNKLTREAGLDLSRMQDIGGCRVVVETLPELRKLEARIRRTWGYCLDHEKDYIREPRASGYRAMHLVVLRDGRQIEIQLRTKSMHNWAEAVEAFSGTTSQNFKQDGSHVVQEFMKQLSDYNAATEAGDTPPLGSLDKLAKLSNEVSVYLKSLHPGV